MYTLYSQRERENHLCLTKLGLFTEGSETYEAVHFIFLKKTGTSQHLHNFKVRTKMAKFWPCIHPGCESHRTSGNAVEIGSERDEEKIAP